MADELLGGVAAHALEGGVDVHHRADARRGRLADRRCPRAMRRAPRADNSADHCSFAVCLPSRHRRVRIRVPASPRCVPAILARFSRPRKPPASQNRAAAAAHADQAQPARPGRGRGSSWSSRRCTPGRSLQTGSTSHPAARARRARADRSPTAAAPAIDRSSANTSPRTAAPRAARRAIQRRERLAGSRVDGREQHMGHHDGRQTVGDQAPVGQQVLIQIHELAPVDRQRQVRVGHDRSVSGEVLGGGRHAGIAHAVHIGDGQRCHHAGARVKGSIADDLATARSPGPRRARRRCRLRTPAAPRP